MNNPVQLKKILVVEDESDIQTIVKITLETLTDFEIEVCDSGKKALFNAKTFSPDLILLDVMLPDMDGPTVLASLQKEPQTKLIPVIFMTAKVQPQDILHYKNIGAIGIIPKPFDPMTLPATIRNIWKGSHG